MPEGQSLLLGGVSPTLWCGCNVGARGLSKELALSHGRGVVFSVGSWTFFFFFYPKVKHRGAGVSYPFPGKGYTGVCT